MAATPAPGLFTEDELEVASFLPEISRIVLESAPQVPVEKFRWGTKRRRTEPAGKISSHEEKKKKEERAASRATPLRIPNSGCEKEIVHPPSKRLKKHNLQLKENKDPLAVLYKKRADLSREVQELKDRMQRQTVMNMLLRVRHFKLSVRALKQLIPQGPTLMTEWSSFIEKPDCAPLSQLVQPMIDGRRMEFDSQEKPADDVADDAVAAAPTCQSREDKAAKSAQARRRPLLIQRERTSPSAAQYRPCFR